MKLWSHTFDRTQIEEWVTKANEDKFEHSWTEIVIVSGPLPAWSQMLDELIIMSNNAECTTESEIQA